MKSLFSAAALTASAMLLLALAPLPYGYYTLLRLVVCGVCAYGASRAYGLGKQGWVLIFGLIAFLFNPLIPVRFDRGTWAPIDVGTAVVLLVAIFSLRKR